MELTVSGVQGSGKQQPRDEPLNQNKTKKICFLNNYRDISDITLSSYALKGGWGGGILLLLRGLGMVSSYIRIDRDKMYNCVFLYMQHNTGGSKDTLILFQMMLSHYSQLSPSPFLEEVTQLKTRIRIMNRKRRKELIRM